MSEITSIAWCDSTWNPWVGCVPVSPGCKNCYAKALVERHGHDFAKRSRCKPGTFDAPLKWNKKPWVCDVCGHAQPQDILCGQCGCSPHHRRRVFSLSMGDWLDDEVPIQWLADMLDVIRRCPDLDFLLLSKRPENFADRLFKSGGCNLNQPGEYHPLYFWIMDWLDGKLPPNVWFGISAENQEQLERRANIYVDIPAVVHFISAEPLLEELDFEGNVASVADWVIIGGESGPNRRPIHVQSIVHVAENCAEEGVPVFVKQDSHRLPGKQGEIPNHIWTLKQFPIPKAVR